MRKLRKILFPFSCLYGGIVWLRNKFFDWQWISSKGYDFPVICVGNLSVGGTGKSPMTEYLIRLLSQDYRLATLSRGYGRKTKGFHLLSDREDASETGDEPLQFKTKFPEIEVAVDEDRQHGISKLMELGNPPEAIILDDAYQHRKVVPGFTVLLTAYSNIYVKDMLLPAGDLREPKSGAKRADVIIVTKCPKDLSATVRQNMEKQLRLQESQELFFSYIAYAEGVYNSNVKLDFNQLPNNFLLVTGIANPKPLVDFLTENGLKFTHLAFPDHHNFSEKEIQKIDESDFILTTEKDYMRLKSHFSTDKLHYLPIQHRFISGADKFDKRLKAWVKNKLK